METSRETSPIPQPGPMMTLPEAVKQALRKYADFSSRATRAEYWWWVLATVIAGAILGTVDSFILVLIDQSGAFSPLNGIFSLATLLPSLAVSARRLHDIGKTGWWQLLWFAVAFLGLIPLVVGIVLAAVLGFFDGAAPEGTGWLLVGGGLVTVFVQLGVLLWVILWMSRQGQTGPNRFGPDPRSVAESEAPPPPRWE